MGKVTGFLEYQRLHEAAELILSGQESAEVALQDAAFEINDLIAGETCSG